MNNFHGEYVSEVNHELLLFSARGPWNDETMRKGVQTMSSQIGSFDKDSRWGQLSCLYGESLMPPSTFDIFVKQTTIRRQRGLAYLAVVILDSDISMTIRQQVTMCYEIAGVPFGFYDSIDSAMKGLADQQFQFDASEVMLFFKQNDFSL